MSNTSSASTSARASAPVHPILIATARRLAAHFRGPGDSKQAARNAAVEAIAACDPRTAADYLLIGRIFGLSLAAIDATVKAVEPELPAKQQLQFLTKANTLSRAAQQTEAALARSRQQQPHAEPPMTEPRKTEPCQAAPPEAGLPNVQPPKAEPTKAEPTKAEPSKAQPPQARPAAPARHAEDALQALIEQVMAESQAAPSRNTLSQLATPPRDASSQSAIRLPTPAKNHRTTSFRAALLQSSAMPPYIPGSR